MSDGEASDLAAAIMAERFGTGCPTPPKLERAISGRPEDSAFAAVLALLMAAGICALLFCVAESMRGR